MKRVIIFCIVALVGCSSTKNTSDNWDNGASKNASYQLQQQQEHTDYTNDQFPSASPSTEANLP